MSQADMSSDMVLACAALVGRAGAKGFELGYLHDDVPVDEAGWYAQALYNGARITVQDHRSPDGAALALAQRLLSGAACRCGRLVTLNDEAAGCRWQLMGQSWEPSCDAPSIVIPAGGRGDLGAIQAAVNRAQASRWERRGQRPNKGRSGNKRRWEA